ncbi:MAG: hypothetical protein ACREEW_06375 [Caulobacteraceae bacterium]
MAVITAVNTRTVTVAGANLFQLAAQLLGDATQWNRIAQLNGLYDFVVTGVATLKIPAPGTGNGGVLGA